MAKYHLRIITDSCSEAVETALTWFLRSQPGISELHIDALKPYWKNPGQGELNCSFSSSLSLCELQAILADHWETDVADIRWSRIHAPCAVFLWLSTESEANL